jgi:hypothetical protein
MSTVLIVTHKVKNFATWKSGFDAGEAARIHAGIRITGLYQSMDDANDVTMIADVEDVEKMKAFFDNPELKAAMEKAGVASHPEMKLLKSAL